MTTNQRRHPDFGYFHQISEMIILYLSQTGSTFRLVILTIQRPHPLYWILIRSGQV